MNEFAEDSVNVMIHHSQHNDVWFHRIIMRISTKSLTSYFSLILQLHKRFLGRKKDTINIIGARKA